MIGLFCYDVVGLASRHFGFIQHQTFLFLSRKRRGKKMSQAKISLDKEAFFRRIKRIYSSWKVYFEFQLFSCVFSPRFCAELCATRVAQTRMHFTQTENVKQENGSQFPNVGAIVIAVGQDEDVIYSKSTAIQVKRSRVLFYKFNNNTILKRACTSCGFHSIDHYISSILHLTDQIKC